RSVGSERLEQAAYLCRHEATPGRICLGEDGAEPPLAQTKAVMRRRVEIGNAALKRAQHSVASLLIGHRSIEITHGGSPEPYPRQSRSPACLWRSVEMKHLLHWSPLLAYHPAIQWSLT